VFFEKIYQKKGGQLEIRFIYTFDAKTKDALAEQGYTLLYSTDTKWVFDNPTGADPSLTGLSYALSYVLTFEE